MKFHVHLYVPGPDGVGVLTLDETVEGIPAALETASAVLAEPLYRVEKSMCRILAVAQVPDVVLIVYVRNGEWEPVRHAFSFRR